MQITKRLGIHLLHAIGGHTIATSLERTLLALVLSFIYCVPSTAQYDPYFIHYSDMETSFNPAAAGKQDLLNVSIAYALNFLGFENNPQTAYASADMPFTALNRRHSAGVVFMNDKIGLFTHKHLSLQYALQFKLAGGRLSAGIQGGMLSENFNGSKVDLEESNDPAFAKADVTGSAFDIGMGLYYARKNWYAGLSAQHINAPLITLGETNELKVDASYYFTAGCNIKLRNPFLVVKPSVLARTDLSHWRADISGRLVYQNDRRMLYGGINYSPQNSVGLLIGGSFHGIVIGYSYEAFTSGVSLGNGSHELHIGYQRIINIQKKGKNLHKSPRIL